MKPEKSTIDFRCDGCFNLKEKGEKIIWVGKEKYCEECVRILREPMKVK